MYLLYNILAVLAASTTFASAKVCPPLGRVLPAPQSPSQNDAVKEAIKSLDSKLQDKFSATLNMSGVSIGVKSIHEDKQLFNFHYTPPTLSGIGSSKIDEHTIYRVGSISKMMPALIARQNEHINFYESVLKYLPALRNQTDIHPAIDSVPWEDVTIESLASHLSGLSTDMATDLAVFSNGPWTDMGLPAVAKGTGPNCSGLPGTKSCSAEDIIKSINRKPAVYKPYTSPVYSNVAFAVLSMVIEAATHKSFEQVVKESVFDVVGMTSTSFKGPVKSFSKSGFVPKGESTWNATLGVFEAAGGMFSNTVDMLAFSEAILQNKLLSAPKTRQWMKPVTHTSSLGQSVGAPWEILRSNNLTKDGRLIDVYTKTGDLGLYHAVMGVVADYGIAITVLTGGAEVSIDQNARSEIFSAVIQILLPAIDKSARDEASTHTGYIGSFVDKKNNATMTLAMDDGPGLLMKDFHVRGFDVLSNIQSYSLLSTESDLPGGKRPFVEARLYPVGMTSNTKGGAKAHSTDVSSKDPLQSVWRASFETSTEEQRATLAGKLFNVDGSCESWFEFDRASYDYLSLAEFVFISDQHGAIKAAKNSAFDITLAKM